MQGTGPEGVYVRSNCSARALMMVLQEEKVNRMDLRKSGDLVDMQHFQHGGSVEFFYRLHHSELDHGRKISNLIIVIVSLVVAGCLAATLWLVWRYKTKLKVSSKLCCKDHDVAVFDLSNNKSKEFTTDLPGPTDILIDGNQEELSGGEQIAVKRLSGQSGQGLIEFKTEIIFAFAMTENGWGGGISRERSCNVPDAHETHLYLPEDCRGRGICSGWLRN
ncbi:hypothetical protein V6N12_062968 [Hibiscus sabdariffa]|uniref:Uncharacterized protein n=1 Tax=Hibiscus sabdariffa TaxID=183260 RepID=A0ABR2FAH1_9ROSI